ncbi:MAG: type VI secretion system contractile sheath large subunit, partial [Acidobacteriaceae bacterium]|nr:type VI secretion system contractile sheath large subunit [Acidobacteriaceae bacterium]
KLGSSSVYRLGFEALDDFEPDRVVDRSELFRRLEGATPAEKGSARRAEKLEHQVDMAKLASGSLLDAILGEEEASRKQDIPARQSQDELRAIINRATEPYLERKPGAREKKRAADREQGMSLLLRAILHEPKFQRLEAAWRSLDFLVRGLETDELLKVYIFDISKEKLTADLLESADFRSSNTYRVIVEDSVRTPGAQPWALLVGNYSFDRKVEGDVELLGSLGLLARAARAPFLAECLPSESAANSSESWPALRESACANWIGLALPRFLLRLPYGKETVPTERFAFEEMPGTPEHGKYLWGNPAFVCAHLLGTSFSEMRWEFRPGLHREIQGLPLHVFRAEGTSRAQPCAEILLTETDCNDLLDEGLMPLASVKDRDSVRLVRFQSVADPAARLSGRWG